MDKKNTMLLTVIAVATLLVAVVGATFAYFSVAQADNQTIQASVKTGKIPTVTVTSEHQNLYLAVNATDMAQSGTPKYYYAKDSNCEPETSCYQTGTEDPATNYIDIAKVTIAGGDEDTKYTCTGSIKVTSSDLTSISGLQPADITIGLKNHDGNDGTTTIDANTVKSGDGSASENLNFKFNSNGDKTISAYVLLKNKDTDQSYLAGKDLTFTITTENVKCTIDAAPAA